MLRVSLLIVTISTAMGCHSNEEPEDAAYSNHGFPVQVKSARFWGNADGYAHVELFGNFYSDPAWAEFVAVCSSNPWEDDNVWHCIPDGEHTPATCDAAPPEIHYGSPTQFNIRIPSTSNDRRCSFYLVGDDFTYEDWNWRTVDILGTGV